MREPTCRAVRPLLSAWLDGELPAAQAAQVARHASACPDCRVERHGLAVVRSLARNLPVRALPAEIGPRAVRASRPRAGAAAAAVVLVVTAGLLGGAAFALGAEPDPASRTVHVPMDVFVADHLVHAVHGPVTTPVLDDGGP